MEIKSFFNKFFIAILTLLFIACGGATEQKELTETAEEAEEIWEDVIEIVEESSAPDELVPETVDTLVQSEYNKIILTADSLLLSNQWGNLYVWIGSSEIEVSFPEGMVSDETTMPKLIGKYFKIEIISPGLEISDYDKEKCYQIVPSGSKIPFNIRHQEAGKYDIIAKIEVFENTDCTGSSAPQASDPLSVTIKVDKKKKIRDKANDLLEISWDKFLSFWGALITLLFSVSLFLIRRKLKKKAKIEDLDQDS